MNTNVQGAQVQGATPVTDQWVGYSIDEPQQEYYPFAEFAVKLLETVRQKVYENTKAED